MSVWGDNPVWQALHSKFDLPSLETIEGAYLNEIRRLSDVYCKFLGVTVNREADQ